MLPLPQREKSNGLPLASQPVRRFLCRKKISKLVLHPLTKVLQKNTANEQTTILNSRHRLRPVSDNTCFDNRHKIFRRKQVDKFYLRDIIPPISSTPSLQGAIMRKFVLVLVGILFYGLIMMSTFTAQADAQTCYIWVGHTPDGSVCCSGVVCSDGSGSGGCSGCMNAQEHFRAPWKHCGNLSQVASLKYPSQTDQLIFSSAFTTQIVPSAITVTYNKKPSSRNLPGKGQ
jgi:hypothetical protein